MGSYLWNWMSLLSLYFVVVAVCYTLPVSNIYSLSSMDWYCYTYSLHVPDCYQYVCSYETLDRIYTIYGWFTWEEFSCWPGSRRMLYMIQFDLPSYFCYNCSLNWSLGKYTEVVNIPIGLFNVSNIFETHGEVIIHNNDIIIQKK